MKLETTPRPVAEFPLGLVLASLLFFLPLGAYYIETGAFQFSECGFKRMFDLPCFSCGSTRATIHLLHGDVVTAVRFQPLTMLIYSILMTWGAISGWALWRRVSIRPKFGKREDIAVKLTLVALPILNWVYLWWAGI